MLEQLKQIIRAAGQIILSAGAEKDVTEKTGSRDLVTKYDKAVEAFLRARLLALLPEAGFMGEESIHSEDWTRYEWLFIVDPIDGTTNFVQGYANWSTTPMWTSSTGPSAARARTSTANACPAATGRWSAAF